MDEINAEIKPELLHNNGVVGGGLAQISYTHWIVISVIITLIMILVYYLFFSGKSNSEPLENKPKTETKKPDLVKPEQNENLKQKAEELSQDFPEEVEEDKKKEETEPVQIDN